MATVTNAITYQMQIQLTNGSISDAYSIDAKQVDQNNAELIRNVVLVPADFTIPADNLLDTGGVGSNVGWAAFINNDATNDIEIGSNNGGSFLPLMKLKAGEQQICRLYAPPYALATGSASSLFYIIYAD